MEEKYKFQRNYFIFDLEDTGYGIGHEPTGYIKIEIRNGKGKLFASMQNLKHDASFSYNLCAFDCSGESIYKVDIGEVRVVNNKAEIQLEFNPGDLLNTGKSIDDFSVFAFLVESKELKELKVICPLAAYRSKKVDWREKLRARVLGSQVSKKEEFKTEYKDISIDSSEDEYLTTSNEKECEITSEVDENASEEESGSTFREEYENISDEEESESTSREEYENISEEKESESTLGEEECGDVSEEEYEDISREEESEATSGEEEYTNVSTEEKTEVCIDLANQEKYWERDNNKEKEITSKVYRQCPAGISSCEDCSILKNRKQSGVHSSKPPSKPLSIATLAEYFDKYFEKSDPFNSRRRDYRWWEVSTPSYLSNILYQFGIKTPELFNPNVMMAHLKYRYLIVGIYTDRIRRREYIVFGIPGIYSVDARPLGGVCRWVQLKGSRPREGAFGYWLVYFEPESGEFLSFN